MGEGELGGENDWEVGGWKGKGSGSGSGSKKKKHLKARACFFPTSERACDCAMAGKSS